MKILLSLLNLYSLASRSALVISHEDGASFYRLLFCKTKHRPARTLRAGVVLRKFARVPLVKIV
jgi:hypothetical protein